MEVVVVAIRTIIVVQHLIVIWEPTGNESMGAWDTEKSWLKDELMTTTASSSSDIIRRQFFDETHQQKFLGYPPFTT